MTRLLRWVSRCLKVIQIFLIISHPKDAEMVRLDLKFHTSSAITRTVKRVTFRGRLTDEIVSRPLLCSGCLLLWDQHHVDDVDESVAGFDVD
jgi:hypothetical protein